MAPDVAGLENTSSWAFKPGLLDELEGQTDMTADDWKVALTALQGDVGGRGHPQYAVAHFGVVAVAKAYDRATTSSST